MPSQIRLLHVIPNLGQGGAEVMTTELLCRIDRKRFVPAIASLSDRTSGGLEVRLECARVPIYRLGKQPGFDHRVIWTLKRLIDDFRPSVVHTHIGALPYA